MGSLIAAFGSLVIGGVVATGTIVGLVNSQTAAPDQSPVSISSTMDDLVPYGTN